MQLHATMPPLALKRSQPAREHRQRPQADEVSTRGRGARTATHAKQVGAGGAPDVDGRLHYPLETYVSAQNAPKQIVVGCAKQSPATGNAATAFARRIYCKGDFARREGSSLRTGSRVCSQTRRQKWCLVLLTPRAKKIPGIPGMALITWLQARLPFHLRPAFRRTPVPLRRVSLRAPRAPSQRRRRCRR